MVDTMRSKVNPFFGCLEPNEPIKSFHHCCRAYYTLGSWRSSAVRYRAVATSLQPSLESMRFRLKFGRFEWPYHTENTIE